MVDGKHTDMTPDSATPVNGLGFSTSYPMGDKDMNSVTQPSPKLPAQATSNQNPSARTSSSDEPGTPASTSSIRRKLSLTWKRSSSKASARIQAALAAEKEDNKRQSEMPPPKLPASATWTSRNSTDAGSARPSLDTRHRKSSNSLSQGSLDVDTDSNKESQGSQTEQPQRKTVPRSSSTSILTPVQRMLGGKGSIGALRNRQHDSHPHATNEEKEDLHADKIMEKLSSKRKDFSDAARDVDALKRRAVPSRALTENQVHATNLNIFERGEIVDFYKHGIFFTGTKHAKKIIGDLDQASTNFGYDDDRGDYNIVLGDHLAYRYEVVDVLGKGSFGQVVRCIDHKLGALVAVKIIRNKKRFHQQALVEVNILQKLREWVSRWISEGVLTCVGS
jgi:dual specificity tyrosine-phosphorylation-regulated kinase 2/3/4